MVEPDNEVKDLEELIDHLARAADTGHRQLTVEEIISAIGSRSFAPMLLLVGVLVTSPLSGVPAFPTATAIIVFLVSVQILAGRKHFWLPAWLLKRTVSRKKVTASVKWLRHPARFIDYFIKPRLTVLARGVSEKIIALISLVIAAGMPLLELIPFSSSLAGIALATFGLSLVSSDGLLALIGYLVTATTLWLFIYALIL